MRWKVLLKATIKATLLLGVMAGAAAVLYAVLKAFGEAALLSVVGLIIFSVFVYAFYEE